MQVKQEDMQAAAEPPDFGPPNLLGDARYLGTTT